jgi:hypothetical protein
MNERSATKEEGMCRTIFNVCSTGQQVKLKFNDRMELVIDSIVPSLVRTLTSEDLRSAMGASDATKAGAGIEEGPK